MLGTRAPIERNGQYRIEIDGSVLSFYAGENELITGFDVRVADVKTALQKAQEVGLMMDGGSVSIGGVRFTLE